MQDNVNKWDTPLEPLVVELQESEKLYTTAAGNALNDDLRLLFEARATQRHEFVEIIQQESWSIDEQDENGGGAFDALQRGSMTIRAAMTIEPDKTDRLLVDETREADRALLEKYREALSQDLDDPVRTTLERQYAFVQAAQANLATMLGTPDRQMVLGLFATVDHAEQAVRNLEESGFERQHIDLLAREEAVKSLIEDQKDQRADTAKESAAAGAVGGGAIGGLIGLVAGASTALIMGVGTVLTGGALAAAIGITAAGAGIGASYGGIFGALMGWGVTEGDVQHFIEGVRDGKILVAVETKTDRSEMASRIMREADASYVSAHQEQPED